MKSQLMNPTATPLPQKNSRCIFMTNINIWLPSTPWLFYEPLVYNSSAPVIYKYFLQPSLSTPTLVSLLIHHLLIALLTALYPSFLQRVVVVEQVEKQVPQHARLEQVGLQPEVDAERADTLTHHCTQFGQVLARIVKKNNQDRLNPFGIF